MRKRKRKATIKKRAIPPGLPQDPCYPPLPPDYTPPQKASKDNPYIA